MRILATTSRSVTIEYKGDDLLQNNVKKSVYLNDQFIKELDRNVFTLFSLMPDKEYTVKIDGKVIKFNTLCEEICLNIDDFFVNKDGINDDTKSFICAISCLPKNGTLFVGEGKYKLKPIFLKSDMTLYLEKGAELIFETDRNLYPIIPSIRYKNNTLGTWQGDKDDCFASLLTLMHLENVKIVGDGTINGNALKGDWYKNHREKRISWRPFGIYMNNCKNILLQGITVKETPSWNIHPYFCEDVKLYNLNLLNPLDMPTTDGIDVDSCNYVNIFGCYISVGDDCIAIKSGTYDFVKEFGLHPSKNIKIKYCMLNEGHGSVVFGSESSGGIESVEISNCLFKNTDRGFRLKTRRLRGNSLTKDITFKNIKMENVKTPFVINMFYNMGPAGGHIPFVYEDDEKEFNDTTPIVKDLTFENVECEDVDIACATLFGLKESRIDNVVFKNCSFKFKKESIGGVPLMIEFPFELKNETFYLKNVNNITLENVLIDGRNDFIVKAFNVSNLFKK